MIDPIELAAIDRGAGPPVALVHGGMIHSGPAWARNLQPLVDAGYRVIAIDRRGHGRSAPGNAGHIPLHLHADDLRYTLELRGAPQAHLVGVSYGALVCLEFALAWPERTLSLVALEPPLFTWLAGDHDYHIWYERFVEIDRAARAGAALEEWLPAWLRLIDGRLAEEAVPGSPTWPLIERNAPLVFKEETGWEYEPGGEQLEALDLPALILNGEMSEPPMQAIGEMLAERLPNAHLLVIKGAGHDAHAREPDQFNRAVIDFLAGAPLP